jgi:hypothetical protein
MNVSEMIELITEGIQDETWNDTYILNEINNTLIFVSGMVSLPGLISSATVSFLADDGTGIGDLPENFDHDLFEAWNTTYSQELTIRPSLKEMRRVYEGKRATTGRIWDVAVEEPYLHAVYVPDVDQDVLVRYYAAPATLLLSSDGPTYIPAHLHRLVIVDHVLSKLWKLKEQDDDGQSPNTNYHTQQFSAGLEQLRRRFIHAPKAQPVMTRRVQYF